MGFHVRVTLNGRMCLPVHVQVELLEVVPQDKAAGMHPSANTRTGDRVVILSASSRSGMEVEIMEGDDIYASLCCGWTFEIDGCGARGGAVSVWAQRLVDVIPPARQSPISCLSAQRVVVGRLEDRRTFSQNFVVAEKCIKLTFERGCIKICVPGIWGGGRCICIRVDDRSLSSFSLVNWNRSCDETATFYLSLDSTPVVSVIKGYDEQERITGLCQNKHTHPLLSALASDFVLAISRAWQIYFG